MGAVAIRDVTVPGASWRSMLPSGNVGQTEVAILPVSQRGASSEDALLLPSSGLRGAVLGSIANVGPSHDSDLYRTSS